MPDAPPPSAADAARLTPDAALVERFRADALALTGDAPSPDRAFGVAVSGGADSLALLLLSAAAFPGAVVAATVDHGLREESADEAAMVGALCAKLGVPHEVLPVTLPPGNLQARAREARYAALGDWAFGSIAEALRDAPHRRRAGWVATGHQRDDVAEGFLLRARRGAGVAGLAAVAPRRAGPDGGYVRPLLGWSRAELAGIVVAAGIDPVDDPSNHDPRFDRARIRALIAGSDELPAERLAQAAANLRDAEDALSWMRAREWERRATETGPETVVVDMAGLPRELVHRMTRYALLHVSLHAAGRGDATDGPTVERMIAALHAGRTATAGIVKASLVAGGWRFEPAPPHRSH